MHDARPAADRAVFGIGLVLAAAEVDVQLFGLPAEGTHDLGAGAFFVLAQSERKNVIKSARSSAESSSGLPCAEGPKDPVAPSLPRPARLEPPGDDRVVRRRQVTTLDETPADPEDQASHVPGANAVGAPTPTDQPSRQVSIDHPGRTPARVLSPRPRNERTISLGARGGTLTFTRFFTQGALPKDLRRKFLEAAKLRVFEPLKPEDEALEATGWCVMERPFDLELDSAKLFHDNFVLLGFRVDRYRIPGALLKSQIADEEQRQLARGKKTKLSRNEKLEIKDRVVMRLRKKVIPSSKAIDLCWHLDSGIVLFFGHSKRMILDFAALFEKTFGLALLEDSPSRRRQARGAAP